MLGIPEWALGVTAILAVSVAVVHTCVWGIWGLFG